MDSRTSMIDRRRAPKGIAGFGAGAALAVGRIGRATAQEATAAAPFVEEVGLQQQMRKLWQDHILQLADVLSGGIIAQFPDMFA